MKIEFKRVVLALLAVMTMTAGATYAVAGDVALVIHGGAGTIKRDEMTPELDREYRANSKRRSRPAMPCSRQASPPSTRSRRRFASWKTLRSSMPERVPSSRTVARTRWTQRSWTGVR